MARPKIVCLCGSTRFWREFQRQSLRLTLEGKIVLSIGAATGTDDEHFGNMPKEEYDRVKKELDELHLRKIDLAHEVLILNTDGYIGESTRRELDYAVKQGKVITFLEPEKAPTLPPPNIQKIYREGFILDEMLHVLGQVEQLKPGDRSDLDRVYAETRTLLQHALSFFYYWTTDSQ